MQIQVLPFGQLAEITGKERFAWQAADTDSLQRTLGEKYPALKERKYAIAVNRQLVKQNTVLTENAEVALLPPFSGG